MLHNYILYNKVHLSDVSIFQAYLGMALIFTDCMTSGKGSLSVQKSCNIRAIPLCTGNIQTSPRYLLKMCSIISDKCVCCLFMIENRISHWLP